MDDVMIIKSVTYGDICLIVGAVLILVFLVHTYVRVAWLSSDLTKILKLLEKWDAHKHGAAHK